MASIIAAPTSTPPVPPATGIDFTHRLDPAAMPELMDEAQSYEDLLACLRDLATITRLTFGYGPTLRFLRQAFARLPANFTPQLLDIGSGGGDVLRGVARWAHRRNLRPHLVGLDLNPLVSRAARQLSAGHRHAASIQWQVGDLFTNAGTQAPDLVLSSLVTHHMRDAEIVRFLRWMEEHTRIGWFVSDLRRSRRSYALFRLWSRAMRWHPFVRHDGPLSIRRAFTEEDWHRLLRAAGIPATSVKVHRCGLGRLCLTRLR